jgi:hypothetical protein
MATICLLGSGPLRSGQIVQLMGHKWGTYTSARRKEMEPLERSLGVW